MSVLIKNARVFDADTDYQKRDILVEGQYITRVCEHIEPESAEQVLEFSGKTVMPGFVDSHVHVVAHNIPQEDMLRAFARNGVAAVRDLGILGNMSLEPYMQWLGERKGPAFSQVVTAGRYIDIEGGYGMGPEPDMAWGLKLETPEDGVRALHYERSRGVDGLKIGLQDDSFGPDVKKMNGAFIRKLTETAAALGMWSTAHISTVEDLRTVVECGIGDAAHTPQDGLMDEALITLMVEKGIPMTTTIGDPVQSVKDMPRIPPKYESREAFLQAKLTARDMVLENLRRFYECGGTILVGTDLMRMTDVENQAAIPVSELQHLAAAGMTPQEAVAACTVNNATACGIDDLGLVKVGMRGCLIAFDGVLDESFEKLRHPPFVMNRGDILKNDFAL